jgi:hypothetical protein
LRKEQRFNVVATPFTTPAVGNMLFHPKPTVSTSAVRDNPDGLVSDLISADVAVETYFITSNDDEPFLGERVADCIDVRLRRLGVLRVPKLT